MKLPLKIFIILLFHNTLHYGQQNIFELELEMKEVYDTIFSMDETETRDSLNDFLISSFNEILKTPEALYYPWKNLDKIGNLVSEDGKLRVFTWHLPVKNGSNYIYYGFIFGYYLINEKFTDNPKN